MSEGTPRLGTVEDYRRRMIRVLMHIQRNLDQDLGLAELAEVACFSPYHFHRVFRGMVGEGVMEHVRRLRLERAATALRRTRRAVTELALEAGYGTAESFTRAFRALYGANPTGWRAGAGRRPGSPRVHYRGDGREPVLPRKGGGDVDVRIEVIEAARVACVRHVGPYSGCGAAWEALLPGLGAAGYLGGDTRFIGLCWDDPDTTPPEAARYDACVTVDAAFKPRAGVETQTVGGGEYAVVTHVGPWATMGDTYLELGRWLPGSGRIPRGEPGLEIYLTDPESTEPEDMLTDICIPLEPTRRTP